MRTKHKHLLSEALSYKDMVGMVKPTIHVDEFAAKMGDDEDIIVVSFYVRSEQAARDLVDWFEKGYDWVMDADRSPGEIRPGRYLVFVEIRRRSTVPMRLSEMLDDLGTLTEHENQSQWSMSYQDNILPFSPDTFAREVPLSPRAYREQKEKSLNEARILCGIQPKALHDVTRDLRQLQSAAGI